jgi:hypothetical protein
MQQNDNIVGNLENVGQTVAASYSCILRFNMVDKYHD